MTKWSLLTYGSAVLIVGLLTVLPGCAAAKDPGPCMPSPIEISPTATTPGATVHVSSAPADCGVTNPEETTYTLSLMSSDQQRYELVSVPAKRDGQFEADVVLPEGVSSGRADLYIRGSSHDLPCDDGESCAAYSAPLNVD